MSRTPLLTAMLWTTVGAASLGACGDDPAVIVDAAILDGTADAAVGPIAQFASTLDLSAACGVALPPTVDLTVSNAGNATLTISGATASGGFAVTTTFPIDVPAGGSTTVSVRPPAAVVGTDLGGATKTGTLAFNTNQPGTTGTVTLTSTVQGANLVFQNATSQTITQIDLSSNSGACPPPATVFIRNTGNMDAMLLGNASASTGFSTTGYAPSSTIAPGSTVSHDVRALVFGSCTAGDTLHYQVTGTICTATPLALQATLNITGSSSCFCS